MNSWRSGLLRVLVAGIFVAAVAPAGADAPPDDAVRLDGVWDGSWGGGMQGDVVFQPVRAELVIHGKSATLRGFPGIRQLKGKLRIDASAKQLQVLPAREPGRDGIEAPATFQYRQEGESLTLVDQSGTEISFLRVASVDVRPAQLEVVLVSASSVNEQDGLVTDHVSVLRTSEDGAPFFAMHNIAYSLRGASLYVVQDTDVKSIELSEARQLVQNNAAVALVFRQDGGLPGTGSLKLWEAAALTLARTLRPGTLICILPPAAAVPAP